MLVFNKEDKYGANEQSDISCTTSVQEKKSFPLSANPNKRHKKKLTQTSIQFLKSQGFKVKPQQ